MKERKKLKHDLIPVMLKHPLNNQLNLSFFLPLYLFTLFAKKRHLKHFFLIMFLRIAQDHFTKTRSIGSKKKFNWRTMFMRDGIISKQKIITINFGWPASMCLLLIKQNNIFFFMKRVFNSRNFNFIFFSQTRVQSRTLGRSSYDLNSFVSYWIYL